MPRSSRFFPILATLLLGAIAVRAEEPSSASLDEETLKRAAVGTDTPSLLGYFRDRTLTEQQRREIVGLIAKLGDDSYDVREEATETLRRRGALAAPLLRRAAAVRGADLEIVHRAGMLLEPLPGPEGGTIAAAVRTLAARKAAGAPAALLAYLPSAEDEWLVDEIRTALAALALRDGQPEPALVESLRAANPLARGAAAGALARAGQLAAVRTMLKDPDPGVRLWTALGASGRKEKSAVPVLIALLAELPVDDAWRAEDALVRLAGSEAPAVTPGAEPAARLRCRDAWALWWEKNSDRVDLTRLGDGPAILGLNLFVKINLGTRTGQVLETGRDGKVRWKIDGLGFPVDAQLLPGERVLVTEYDSGRITERDFTGKVLWEKTNIPQPINARRLANGHTFVATGNSVMEFDRDGGEVFKVNRPGTNATGRLPDGRVVCVTSQGQCTILDKKGGELKSFAVNATSSWTSGIEVLPNGRILVPDMAAGRVVEYDADGAKIGEVKAPVGVTNVTRLENGNLLVATEKSGGYEIDRTGKIVQEFKEDLRMWSIRRR
jgi:HEAT repeat protein